jgi:diguanylate cyclase (GGDEF)-like protein
MISIKKYLEQTPEEAAEPAPAVPLQTEADRESGAQSSALLPAAVAALRSALVEMGNCGRDACPALGGELKQSLGNLAQRLCKEITCSDVEETESRVREELQEWGRRAAEYYRKQSGDVKEILLMMARAAESVGERDQRAAAQINEVTTHLKSIANLEDLTEIRESIKQSATKLKSSIDRMAAEGKAAINKLQGEVSSYQAKLEEAEEIAARDALTGLHSRLWVEGQIEQALHARPPFCVAILDLNEFKRVNDEHGHLVGDELLKKLAAKLKSVCRSTDTIGRWGGDEFLLLLHCGISEARAQIDRLREWVCGNYTLAGNSGPVKLCVAASIGLAERLPGESMKELVERADAEMYRDKAASRAAKSSQSAQEK